MDMKRIVAMAVGLVLGTLAALVAGAATGRSQEAGSAQPPWLVDPSVPRMAEDLGVGESLYLVLGGIFPSRQAAEAANAALAFGDMQGFYAVPVAQFRGLARAIDGGGWALVSAFRTLAGANEFKAFATYAGAAPTIEGPFESLGGLYAGLGQEARPDGTGALLEPLPGGGTMP
jgi:hypothetical protein